MGIARGIARTITRLRLRSLARRPRDAYAPGSAGWLILTEAIYGGYHADVSRNRVSPLDPRGPAEISAGGQIGGDRMSPLHHGYARWYARYLAPLAADRERAYTVVEVGILKGTGLALWCDLFPRAMVFGLDVDLSHFRENEGALRSRGAFSRGGPRLAEFDQFVGDAARLGEILGGRRIDVLVDDGFHSDETILRTFEAARPHLAERFVYFAEDNPTVGPALRSRFPEYDCHLHRELTVVTSR